MLKVSKYQQFDILKIKIFLKITEIIYIKIKHLLDFCVYHIQAI